MKGFFSLSQADTTLQGDALCSMCPLSSANCLTPKMPPTGKFQKQILIVGEAPGAEEDKVGKQFVGKAGKKLRWALSLLDYDLERDFLVTNTVNCRPPKNRTPVRKEIEACRPMLLSLIDKYKPKVIILLGSVATQLIKVEWKKGIDSFLSVTGHLIPSKRFNCWLAPIFHPSFVMREEARNPVINKLFLYQLRNAISYADKPLPFNYLDEPEKCSKLLLEEKDIIIQLKKVLRIARKNKIALAFDYETTGLKPHAEVHKIHNISFSYDLNQSYSFWTDGNEDFLNLWFRILKHPNILKIAHNMKYEDSWTYHLYGFRPKPWYWDTMLVAHVLDNRSNLVSLKLQSYLHFGVAGYDDDIKKFLKADTSNDKNTVAFAPKQKILLYNAIDSLMTFRLFAYQHTIIYKEDVQGISNLNKEPFLAYI